MVDLFELKFIDGTELICRSQNDKAVYTTIGGGLSSVFKSVFDKMEYRYICATAYMLSKENDHVIGYKEFN